MSSLEEERKYSAQLHEALDALDLTILVAHTTEDLEELYECNGRPEVVEWLRQAPHNLKKDIFWNASGRLHEDGVIRPMVEAVDDAYRLAHLKGTNAPTRATPKPRFPRAAET